MFFLPTLFNSSEEYFAIVMNLWRFRFVGAVIQLETCEKISTDLLSSAQRDRLYQ